MAWGTNPIPEHRYICHTNSPGSSEPFSAAWIRWQISYVASWRPCMGWMQADWWLWPTKMPKSRSNWVILLFHCFLVHTVGIKSEKQSKKKNKQTQNNKPPPKKNPKLNKEQQQHSVWSPQEAAWGLRRCLFNSWPDTSLTDTQTEDRHLAPAAKTSRAPTRAVSVPLDHRGGKEGTLVINALLKIIVKASLSTKAVIAHLYYTELFLISSFLIYLKIVNWISSE